MLQVNQLLYQLFVMNYINRISYFPLTNIY